MSNGAIDLSATLGGLKLKSPVLTASGCFGYGAEFAALAELNAIGGVVTKGISLNPRTGHPPPRICETPAGMLNAIGLENVGLEVFLKEKLPALRAHDTAVVVNIFGTSVAEYAELAARLDGQVGVQALELNLSCPHVEAGGMEFGRDPAMVAQVIAEVKKASALPVIAKLTPNVTDVTLIARAAADAGADAVTLINTVVGMAIDIHARRPVLSHGTGGLSGPAIRPIAVRMVYQTAKAVSIPIIGCGGISRAEDALEFFLAGARAVQVGTALFNKPDLGAELTKGIASYLAEKGFGALKDIVGLALSG